jgi:hypothetical protein
MLVGIAALRLILQQPKYQHTGSMTYCWPAAAAPLLPDVPAAAAA